MFYIFNNIFLLFFVLFLTVYFSFIFFCRFIFSMIYFCRFIFSMIFYFLLFQCCECILRNKNLIRINFESVSIGQSWEQDVTLIIYNGRKKERESQQQQQH